MSRILRTFARTATIAAVLAATPALARAQSVAPLSSSSYAVRSACALPQPGRANCLALQLVPVSSEAKRHTHPIGMVQAAARAQPAAPPSPATGELGLRPQDLHSAYSLPTSAPGPTTIALIDAYNDPRAEEDLAEYDKQFGLPPCTHAVNECFRQVGQTASSTLPFPKTVKQLEEALASKNTARKEEAQEAAGWAAEISLDIDAVHATCQTCRILLIEANTPLTTDLTAAEKRAEELGASEISNSWGTPERSVSATAAEQLPFNDPGTVITASAGDEGYRNWRAKETPYTSFPASAPSIVAVGGTRLAPLKEGAWTGETVWNGSGAGGGGCSEVFTAPSWQSSAADWPLVGCGTKRAVADVSADADPYSGIVIRDTMPGGECETPYVEHQGEPEKVLSGWCTYGGTSLSSPIIASVFALAGGAQGKAYATATLYETQRNAPRRFHDVTEGSNGECTQGFDARTGVSSCTPAQEAAASCASKLICLASSGYDGPSGTGTPFGVLGFTPGQYEASEAAATTPSAVAPAVSSAPRAATPPPLPAPPPVSVTATVVVLSSLGLTDRAVSALNRRPTSAKVAFAFRANVATRLRASLARRVVSHGRTRWVAVGRAVIVSAAAGHNVKRLTGARRLAPGVYRLTLTASTGRPRTLVFRVR